MESIQVGLESYFKHTETAFRNQNGNQFHDFTSNEIGGVGTIGSNIIYFALWKQSHTRTKSIISTGQLEYWVGPYFLVSKYGLNDKLEGPIKHADFASVHLIRFTCSLKGTLE